MLGQGLSFFIVNRAHSINLQQTPLRISRQDIHQDRLTLFLLCVGTPLKQMKLRAWNKQTPMSWGGNQTEKEINKGEIF